MKCELILRDDKKFLNEFLVYDGPNKFGLMMGIDDKHTLEKQLKNKKVFEKAIEIAKEIKTTEEIIEINKDKAIKYMTENYDNLFEKFDYIYLKFNNIDVHEYIRNNPIIQSKKLVLPYRLRITEYDRILELMNEYSDIVEKIYIHLENNVSCDSLLDCYKTMNEIKKYAENIKYLGLSKIETIMYVYDMVRNRVYVGESEMEDISTSRDLSKILFGDKIVCLGYANLFNVILCYLGIDSYIFELQDKNATLEGHARNAIYVKDDKYNIDGVYFFDATWDSKRFEEDNSYLRSYRFFAKTIDYMNEYDKASELESYLSNYSKDMCKKLATYFRKDNYAELFKYAQTVREMLKLTNNKNKIPFFDILSIVSSNDNYDTTDFLKGLREIHKLFTKEIPAETMIQILNNVRKVEYVQDPSWYPYTIDELYTAFINSEWKFKHCYLTEEHRLLKNLGYEISNKKLDLLNFKGYAQENNIFKTIEQVRISKVLKLVLEKRISEQTK